MCCYKDFRTRGKVERLPENKALEDVGGASRGDSRNRELLFPHQDPSGFYLLSLSCAQHWGCESKTNKGLPKFYLIKKCTTILCTDIINSIQITFLWWIGKDKEKGEIPSRRGAAEYPVMLLIIEYFYNPLWKLPSEVVGIVLFSFMAVSLHLRRYIYYLNFSWKNLLNIYKRRANSIMNHHVPISQLQ